MRVGALKVEQMKRATRAEYASHFTKGLPFLVRRKMVVHEGRKDAIEGAIRVRETVRKTLLELDGQVFTLRFMPGAGERLGIGIQPDD